MLDLIDTPQYWAAINVLHSIILGPMLLWTGWKLLKGQSLPSTYKNLLSIIGTIVVAYHSIRAYQKYKDRNEQLSMTEMLSEYDLQVNLAHLLFIGPLIAWVGYKLSNGRAVTQLEQILLMVLGGAGTVYHSLKVYKMVK